MCNHVDCSAINVRCFVDARNAYAYPPQGLTRIGPIGASFAWRRDLAPRRFPSSADLDRHHTDLLLSADPNDVVTAIFSVMYWGHRTAGGRSETRCDWLQGGNARNRTLSLSGVGLPSVLAIVRCAVIQVGAGNLAAAFTSIGHLPHVGASFATKYLAFMDPENIGVFDSRIQDALHAGTYTPILGAACVNGILAQPRASGRQFHAFCEMLNAVKDCLNRHGGTAWRDATGGALNRFRAIDVERALFQIAGAPPTTCP